MSLRTDPLITGRLKGTIYTFEVAGDSIPMHRHTDVDVHIIIVARGRFRIHGPIIGDNEYGEGSVLDLFSGIDHEVIALTNNARTVHILKYGE